jgi:hypothetical protein
MAGDRYGSALVRWRCGRSQIAGQDFGHNAEMAEVIKDGQLRARYEPGGVMGVDDVDDLVASAVQDSDRAPDGCDIEGDPSCAARQAIVSVTFETLGEHGRKRRRRLLGPRRISEQRPVGSGQRCRIPRSPVISKTRRAAIGEPDPLTLHTLIPCTDQRMKPP